MESNVPAVSGCRNISVRELDWKQPFVERRKMMYKHLVCGYSVLQ